MKATCGRAATPLALLLALGHAPADAGRPLSTDDAGVLASKSCEWESYLARSRSGEHSTAFNTQAGCGIGHDSQFNASLVDDRSDTSHSYTAGLYAKTLLGQFDAGWSFAISGGFNQLRESRRRGQSGDENSDYVVLIASHALSDATALHLNVGGAYAHRADSFTTPWNVALDQSLTDDLGVTAEVYRDAGQSKWAAAGVRFHTWRNCTLSASFAHPFDPSGSPQVTIGFMIDLP